MLLLLKPENELFNFSGLRLQQHFAALSHFTDDIQMLKVLMPIDQTIIFLLKLSQILHDLLASLAKFL